MTLFSRKTVLLSALIMACVGVSFLGLVNPKALQDVDVQYLVRTLASDEFEGRLTGSDGIERAANFIIEQLKSIGAEPLPGQIDFRLPFNFTAGVSDGGTVVTIASKDTEPQSWEGLVVQALSLSKTGTVTAPLVFAGYGLSVSEADGFSYDSYAALDVTDKIVLVLRYFPEDTDGNVREILSKYSGLRYKAFTARQHGAKGLIVVTGPRSPNAGELVPLTFDNASANSDIVAASVNGEFAESLIARTGQSLNELQRSLDSGNPHVNGFTIPDVELTLSVTVNHDKRVGYNVVGYLPAPALSDVSKPYIMLGAHYDHLGYGVNGNSLARKGEVGKIHNGADDNASGVAAVIAAGARLVNLERKRGIILSFWSGEEIGLLGSAKFVESSPLPIEQIAAYINFDMVGRLRQNKLSVQAVGSSSIWTDLVRELNKPLGFDIQFTSDPYLPTDVMSFNQAEVPSVAFFTGSHEDYHRPTDDSDTVNYQGLDRITELGTMVADRLSMRIEPPDFIKVDPVVRRAGQGPLRIFTGTIPDYQSEEDGLLLSGVVSGGPAEMAGLQGGDVIVELAGHTIVNIYDYTYALDLLKVESPASIIFVRDGKRIKSELVPQARE